MSRLRQHCAHGVSTARHMAALPVPGSADELDVPVGCFVVRWSISSNKRVWSKELSADYVTCMHRLPDGGVLTADHAGGLALWSADWKLRARAAVVDASGEAMTLPVMHVSAAAVRAGIDGDWQLRIALSAHVSGVDDAPCLLQLLRVDGGAAKDGEAEEAPELVGMWSLPDSSQYKLCELLADGDVFAIAQSERVGSAAARLALLSGSAGECLCERQLDVGVTVCQRSADGRRVAIADRRRDITVCDGRTLQSLVSVHADGSGALRTLLWLDSSTLAFQGEHAILAAAVHSSSESKDVDVRRVGGVSAHTVEALARCDDGSRLWVAVDGSLIALDLMSDSKECHSAVVDGAAAAADSSGEGRGQRWEAITRHELTCCGLDFSPDGSMVAVGDFTQMVKVWSTADDDCSDAIAMCTVAGPVRSIAWSQYDDMIIIGCMGGALLVWHPLTGLPPEQLLRLDRSVTAIQWQPSTETDGVRQLAAATTAGTLYTWSLNERTGFFTRQLELLAHPPGRARPGFGSLAKRAEVWSLAWSPCGSMLATCSEDQTTKVWSTDGKLLRSLDGHSSAVTCVDWRETALGSILVTSGDDRLVLLWRADDWSQLHRFDAGVVTAFETVTYVALEPDGRHCVCSTEGGRLCVWDLTTGHFCDGGKKHRGSVEGLAWSSTGVIGSCSADCSINTYSVAAELIGLDIVVDADADAGIGGGGAGAAADALLAAAVPALPLEEVVMAARL
eukprot:PLAT14285.1.p1 GENE.PLAT14285.1~~PLAT14285.1.p1  ORF type:complete len:734 (-),score=280.36 PLAT14285.1:49-2250(-)